MSTGTRRADLRTDPYGRIAAVGPILVARAGRGGGRRHRPAGHPRRGRRPHPPAPRRGRGLGQRRLRLGHGRGRGGRHHHGHRVRHHPPRPGTRSTRWPSWQGQAEAAAVDYGFHLTLVDRTGRGGDRRLRRAGDHLVQAVHGLSRDRCRSTTTVIVEVLGAAGRHGGLVTVHAENGPAITRLERAGPGRRAPPARSSTPSPVPRRWRARPPRAPPRWPSRLEAPIYVVHVSSAPALTAVRAAQERGVTIMAETCPQYLYLDVEPPGGRRRRELRVHPSAADP